MPIYTVKIVYEADQFMKVRASSPEEAEEIALDEVEVRGDFAAYVQYVDDDDGDR